MDENKATPNYYSAPERFSRTVPETRFYTWEAKPVWHINEAIAHFKHEHQRAKTPEASKAIALMLEALRKLREEKQVGWIDKPAKLKPLYISCAKKAEWTTLNYSVFQRTKRERDVNMGVDERMCVSCGVIKHVDKFKGKPTTKQRRKYGWSYSDPRLVVFKSCAECRNDKERIERPNYGTEAMRILKFFSKYRHTVRQCKSRANIDWRHSQMDFDKHRYDFWRYTQEYLDIVQQRIRQRSLDRALIDSRVRKLLTDDEVAHLESLRNELPYTNNMPVKWWNYDGDLADPETGLYENMDDLND